MLQVNSEYVGLKQDNPSQITGIINKISVYRLYNKPRHQISQFNQNNTPQNITHKPRHQIPQPNQKTKLGNIIHKTH